MKNSHVPVLITALVLLAMSCHAATWRVEKDGSGDFSVIQDAVDFSADGDTLLIGPGRFDDYRRYDIGAWQDHIIFVLLDGRSLTLIGSGEGATVVGPLTQFDPTVHEAGIVLINGSELSLSDLTVERLYGGVECWDTSYAEVEGCTFNEHTRGAGGAVFGPRGASFQDCTFQNYDTGIFPGAGSVGVEVIGCEFRGMKFGLNTTATQDLLVQDCRIVDSLIGIQLWSSSRGQIVNLDSHCVDASLIIEVDSHVDLESSRLTSDTFVTVWVDGYSSLTGSGNILSGGERTTLFIYHSDVTLFDSHLLAGKGYAVELEPPFPATPWSVDLRNNWWGVNDAAVISELIFDGHDSPEVEVFVEFEPFHDSQVSNESMGWGDLKRLYR